MLVGRTVSDRSVKLLQIVTSFVLKMEFQECFALLPPPAKLARVATTFHVHFYLSIDGVLLQPAFQRFEDCYTIACGATRLRDGRLVYDGIQDAEREMQTRIDTMMVEHNRGLEYVPVATLPVGILKTQACLLVSIVAMFVPQHASP